MSTSKKIFIGLGIAAGAGLAVWLLTGDRRKKTVDYVSGKFRDIKRAAEKARETKEEPENHYV